MCVGRLEVDRGGRISLRFGGWPVTRTDTMTSRMWLAAS